jgi:predicted phage terminase large subunit-like protein
MSVTFIAATFADNAIAAANDPDYADRLDALMAVDRERLKFGRWSRAAKSGGYFRDEWFPRIAIAPTFLRAIRCWDLAATEPSKDNSDPDWTRGALLQRHSTAPRHLMPGQAPPEDAFAITDLESLRAGPSAIDALIERTAERDGRKVEIAFWQDPGQAGKAQAHALVVKLGNRGYAVHTRPASLNKEAYARVWSPLVEKGRVSIVDAGWTKPLLARLEAFPNGRYKDDVDAISLGFQVLTTSAPVRSFRVGGL